MGTGPLRQRPARASASRRSAAGHMRTPSRPPSSATRAT